MRFDPADSGPLLVICAHPDDEFAIYPWLRAAIAAGRRLDVVWLTDGGWGGQDVDRRRAESVSVLASLDLDPSSMHFCGIDWAIADGELYKRLDDVVSALQREFAGAEVGGEVLMPAWEGGHHDHDASHLAGIHLARARRARMSQYPLYHGKGLRGPLFRVLSPLAANGPLRRMPTQFPERLRYVALCTRYRSQWKSFVGLLPFYALRMLRTDAFFVQAVDPARTVERPHPGALLYERRGGPSWAEFSRATAAFRSA